MKRTKEYRRAQRDRAEARWSKRAKQQHWIRNPSAKQLEKWISFMATTPKPNQCQCCCSPRYSSWYGQDDCLTMQERRAKRDFDSQISDL